jgi:hypothetical protein
MFEKIKEIEDRFDQLETELARPKVIQDQIPSGRSRSGDEKACQRGD